jgi:hypothetical protein
MEVDDNATDEEILKAIADEILYTYSSFGYEIIDKNKKEDEEEDE